jgi:hypothetical protein
MFLMIPPRSARSTSDTALGDEELIMTLLRLGRDYLTNVASPATHAELAGFLRSQGIRLDWFIDMLQLTTHHPDTNH